MGALGALSDERDDERRLIAAAQEDRRHFAALYERHFDRVYAFVLTRSRDPDLAEDITAQTFHHAFQSLESFEWRGAPFSAWLFRIAANALADRGRRDVRSEEAAAAVPAAEPASLPSPEEDVGEAEIRARLFRLVERLPADQQRVIRLRYAEERSGKEIAARLGRSEGAIKQLQLRALRTLRAWMSEPDE